MTREVDRFETFVRAVSYALEPTFDADRVLALLRLSLLSLGSIGSEFLREERDRAFVKAAVLGVSFVQELRKVVRGDFDLDDREEAVLDAALEYLRRTVAAETEG